MLFDFDGCMYSWFNTDIAVALYYALPCPPSRVEDRRAFAPRFLHHFMTGYLSEHWLDPAWLTYLPDFLKYEQMANYVLYHQTWDMNQLSDPRKQLLARYRQAIENDTPVVEFDFARWANDNAGMFF
jgi:Ser/Thr protein kinase RdoA (MazF antagonist)